MNFTILGPEEKKTFKISWLEVNTPQGNFVIQLGHVPTILLLSPNQPITFRLNSGKQETIIIPGGILEVTRSSALLLLNR